MQNIIIEDNEIFTLKKVKNYIEIFNNKTKKFYALFDNDYKTIIIKINDKYQYVLNVDNNYNIIKFNNIIDSAYIFECQFENKIIINNNCISYINDINELLGEYCNGTLKIMLNYNYLYDNKPISYSTTTNILLLCLLYNDKCVSSIEFHIDTVSNDIIEIFSKTDELFENRRYNKLLRCVVAQIIYFLDIKIKYIASTAINPISLYLLMQIYDEIIIDEKNNKRLFFYLEKEGKTIEYIYRCSINELKNIFKTVHNIYIIIEINDKNLNYADKFFEETLTKIVCEKDNL